MVKHALLPILASVCLAGCTPSYSVHVNTYAEMDETISPTASIYVAREPNVPNPILRRQIESRMADLLRGYGYRPVETADASDYILTYQSGMDSEQIMDYAPVSGPYGWPYSRPYGGLYGGYFGGWGLGYTTYLPYIDTVYVHWLRMRLLRADGRPGQEDAVVWIGEALTGTDDPDLREAINYLLVGCFEYFPQDTEEWVTMNIERDDPRIIDIMGARRQREQME